jgi:hypothetical protein
LRFAITWFSLSGCTTLGRSLHSLGNGATGVSGNRKIQYHVRKSPLSCRGIPVPWLINGPYPVFNTFTTVRSLAVMWHVCPHHCERKRDERFEFAFPYSIFHLALHHPYL